MNAPRIRYEDLIDVAKLQALLNSFYQVIGIANAVIDIDGVIIAQAGWQDACTQFYRVNPQTGRRCIESDTSLAESMTRGVPYAVYNCLNGLVDTAAPIMVGGQHVANVFTGQFLTAAPDLALFSCQAREFGFDEESYLAAIARVPVVPQERVEAITRLYAQLAGMLADGGLDRLKQQQINAELEKNRMLLDASQKLAHVGGWEWDIVRQAMMWTDEVYRIHGMNPDEFSAGSPEHIERSLACFDPSDRSVIEIAFRRCAEDGITYDWELPLTRVDKRRIWARATAEAVREGGRIVKVIGSFQDITDRKHLEALRDESAAKVRTILDSLEGAVYVADMNSYEILYINEALKNLVGDVVGQTCWQSLQLGMTGPCHFCTNARLVQPDGSPAEPVVWEHFNAVIGRWFQCRDKAIPWPDGRLVRIEMAIDITARKAVEAELTARRSEAEAASRAKSDFLANMSHEIRTPMNGILGMTDLALDTTTEAERQEYMKIVKNSAESLLGILNDILDFSKIEANKLMLEQVGFSLRQAVSETLKTLAPRATQKNLELICDIADDVPAHVLGDPTRLRQVLINLVGNAIKFTAQGEIVVSLAVEARTDSTVTLQVAVRDSGIGIPADKLDSIFEAFAQADASTTRQYGGTGLGLSISSRLVELMGGHMSVDSAVGQGSTFQFTVVLGVDATPVMPLDTAQLAGKQVLVVDDNAVNREIFLRQLDRWGMRGVAAASGSTAQALCGQPAAAPDLILLDQHMPGMDGITLAEWMRAQPHLHDTPLLILSSGPLKDDAERARALNLRGFLSKPVTDTELLTAIRRALGVAEADAAAPQTGTPKLPPSGGKLSVLLVEDNAINQQLAIRLLEKWGHQVTLAVHGQEAVERLCAGERYDIVLMDMQMPVMGGIEATRLIRADERAQGRPRVPIIAMTANAMQGDREACLEAGMDDYLSKPINQVELAAKLRLFAPAAAGTVSGQAEATDTAVPPAPTFDYAEALARMDAEIVEILAPAFLEHGPSELAALQAALAAGDAEEVLRRAHGLKGTLAAFGAQPAERCAAEIETLAKAGDLVGAAALLSDLENEIVKLFAVLSI